MRSPAWNPQFHQHVLALDPIGYWIGDEKQGNVAYDWAVAHGQAASRNGVHVGVTLGQPGIGDGRTAPYYDGINDYTNILTASFQAAFDQDRYSIVAITRMSNVGAWTDGSLRCVFNFIADGNNYTSVRKSNVANRLTWYAVWGGAGGTVNRDAMTETRWMMVGITRDQVAGQAICYYNGEPEGAPIATPNAGGAPTVMVVGAGSVVPTLQWFGWNAHVAVFDRILTSGDYRQLYRKMMSN